MAYTLKIKDGIEWKTVKQVNYITTHEYNISQPICTVDDRVDEVECWGCNGTWFDYSWEGYANIDFSVNQVDDVNGNTPIWPNLFYMYEFIDYDGTNYGGQSWTEVQNTNQGPTIPTQTIYGQESIYYPGAPMPCTVTFAAVLPYHWVGEEGFSSSTDSITFSPHYRKDCREQCSDWEDRGYQSYEDCMCIECNEYCPDCSDCINWEQCGYSSYEDCMCQNYGEMCE